MARTTPSTLPVVARATASSRSRFLALSPQYRYPQPTPIRRARLINLALLIGVGWGYLYWGLRARNLERELAVARATTGKVEGVVRAILPEINVLVLTHGEIPGYMPAMTMGFRAACPKIHEYVRVGDAVRFTVRGVPPNVAIITIEKAR